MATSHKHPGVYIEEITHLPPSVAQVETAIPAFIGYTELDSWNGLSLLNKPTRIRSLKEYEERFGLPQAATLNITVNNVGGENVLVGEVGVSATAFRMYYALQLYFANGGGPCYISSAGNYASAATTSVLRYGQLKAALDAVAKEDEPTILLFPDAPLLEETEFYAIQADALAQCADLMDRVAIIDLFTAAGDDSFENIATAFRDGIGNTALGYGAAYYPWLRTSLVPFIKASLVPVSGGTIAANSFLRMDDATPDLSRSIFHANNKLYSAIKNSLGNHNIILPPSGAVAGIYCQVDNSRGVWKAPANVSLAMVREPMVHISDHDQEDMNVTDSGKSVNAIRLFPGKGILVWGARTLAGNDNEWRYISVRRFCNMVRESVKKASEAFVFESNDANTWVKVKGMAENFLMLQWRAGALTGAKPEEAFFVHVGLGETMTALDISEGRMIVEIGMAALRPAEFTILRFSQKMNL